MKSTPPLTATRPGSRNKAPVETPAKTGAAKSTRRQAPTVGPQDAALTIPAPEPLVDNAATTPLEPAMDGPIPPRASRSSTVRRTTRAPRGPFPLLKAWAIAATVLAVVLGGLLGAGMMDGGVSTPEPRGLLIAALATDGGRWVVQSTADGEQILVQVEGTPKLPNSRSAELWWIGPDDTPVSVGLLPTEDQGRLVLSRQGLTGDEPVPTFAVSVEPTGGSPTGAPTGKVITTFTAIRSL